MNDPSGQARGSRRVRWTIAIAIVAALIPAVPIAAGLAITSPGSRTGKVNAADTRFNAVGPTAGSASAGQSGTGAAAQHGQGSSGAKSGGTASGSTSGSGSSRAGATGSGSSGSGSSGSGSTGSGSTGGAGGGQTPADQGALVALLHHGTAMRVAPGGRVLAQIGTHTAFGSPTTFLVVRQSGGWLGVVSTDAGNGRIGWVERPAVSLGRVHWQLRVSLSARRLTVLENGKTLRRYSVAVGRPDAPTPTGRFAVTDRLATHDPAGPYGCCILALSAHSPHQIQGWSGGNRIAIHSTPDSGSVGQAVSHGCVRVTLAEGTWLLGHIPLGTPAVIRS